MVKPECQKITVDEIRYIKKAKAGDKLAFEKLYHLYKPLVENILRSQLRDEDEAKEMANIVFLKVYKKLDKFTSYHSFGGWIRTITNRVAIDYLRIKENHRYILSEDGSDVSEPYFNEDAEYDAVNHMMVSNIFEILDRYRPHVRKIFELHYLQNMPVELVASKLRIPTGTVKSILSRVRNKIRNQLIRKQ